MLAITLTRGEPCEWREEDQLCMRTLRMKRTESIGIPLANWLKLDDNRHGTNCPTVLIRCWTQSVRGQRSMLPRIADSARLYDGRSVAEVPMCRWG
jgi:hypothetical protein